SDEWMKRFVEGLANLLTAQRLQTALQQAFISIVRQSGELPLRW
ncbi:MAG: hypothetical protein JWM03_151, partial [Rhodocyclales bacterium]|nr:hypothetical protein [Rhodocyclales bacterium]